MIGTSYFLLGPQPFPYFLPCSLSDCHEWSFDNFLLRLKCSIYDMARMREYNVSFCLNRFCEFKIINKFILKHDPII